MKKLHIFSLLFVSALAFTACVNEEDDLFSESAAARLAAAESRYTEILTASPGGWTMEYYPTNDTLGFKAKGYLMLADFEKDGTVRVGMWNAFSGNWYKEDTSLWDIITDNGPVLSFNTYNKCLHAFSDPHDLPASIQGVSGDDKEDVTGLGAEGDYEFVLTNVKANSDIITVKGKKRGSYVRMVKIPEGTNFETYFLALKTFEALYFPSDAINDTYLTVGGRKYVLSGISTGIASLYPADGDPITDTKNYAFVISRINDKTTIRFRKPIVEGDASVQELALNTETYTMDDTEGGDAVLAGPNPNEFFAQKLTGEGALSCYVDRDTEHMSSDYATIYNDLVTALANSSNKYTINDMVFTKDGEGTVKFTINLQYRKGGRTNKVNLDYRYGMAVTENDVTLTYQEPLNTAAENIASSTPAVPALLNKLSGKFNARGNLTPFVLNEMRMVSAADTKSYFRVYYNVKSMN